MTRRGDERGAILVLTALVMLLLLLIAAFATDLGAWYRQGQSQQQASDVASLNGVQTYDREVDRYLNGRTWSDLANDTLREEGESRAMLAAIRTIQGVLETSGFTFSGDPVPVTLAIPPHGPPNEDAITQFTLEADNGATVTITRSVVFINGFWVSQITVQIVDEGDQFLSGIFRDAPEIARSATAAVSACGAECEQTLRLDPPFTGFDAAGSGDGFEPLLIGRTEVWAVNHHSNSKPDVQGDIVCINRVTEQSCGLFPLTNYHTSTHAEQVVIDGKIYFPATRRDVANNTRIASGVVCFDTNTNAFCPGNDEFVGFWPGGSTRVSSPASWIEQNGNELWVSSEFGQLACVTTAMDVCSPGTSDVYDAATQTYSGAADTHTGNRLLNPGEDGQNRKQWAHRYEGPNGTELHIVNRAGANSEAILHCFNLDTRRQCWGGNSYDVGAAQNSSGGFPVFNQSGVYLGICAYSHQGAVAEVGCRAVDGGALAAPNDISGLLTDGIDGKWIGNSFVWESQDPGRPGHRVFFATGYSDRILCYDYLTQARCAENTESQGILHATEFLPKWVLDANAIELADANDKNDGIIEPYGFASVTADCIIGLGDESVFYSFSPRQLTGCTDTSVVDFITPCGCTGGVGEQWGEILLPASLLNDVEGLTATARDASAFTDAEIAGFDTDSGIIRGASLGSAVTDIDVLGSGGRIDLSSLNGLGITRIELQLIVESKLDPLDGLPVWQDTRDVDIEIISSPVLLN